MMREGLEQKEKPLYQEGKGHFRFTFPLSLSGSVAAQAF